MTNNLQFMDCSNCGKRVRTNAIKCHHCQQVLAGTPENYPTAIGRARQEHDHDDESFGDQSHFAVNGGYGADDDFDYEAYLKEEFPDDRALSRPTGIKRWVWITAWILIVATLLPFFYYFLG